MIKSIYISLSKEYDNAIGLLTKDYNRQERRWMLNTPEEIEQVQKDIRNLKHRKLMAWEEYLLDDRKDLPQQIRSMLTPIVARRKFEEELSVKGSKLVMDGSRFIFPAAFGILHTDVTETYQPKHLRGFWTCPACMQDMEKAKALPEDLNVYSRQIAWCPKFIPSLAHDKNPQQYEEALKKINPDGQIPYCYAGLLHSEFQVSDTEAKLVKYCDTCAFRAEEIKQLAQPFDPETFDVSVELGKSRPNLEATCTCKICGEIVFQAPMDQAIDRDGNCLPEYAQKLEEHYTERHPGQ